MIHLGILEDIESYVQESVPAGRDGLQALAILLKKKRNQHANKSTQRHTYLIDSIKTQVVISTLHNQVIIM